MVGSLGAVKSSPQLPSGGCAALFAAGQVRPEYRCARCGLHCADYIVLYCAVSRDTFTLGETMSPGEVSVVRLVLTLAPDPEQELDDEGCERLTRQLRAELAVLDVDSIDSVIGIAAPDGAKAADPVTLGAIVVALSASGGVFTSLIETLRNWLDRNSGRHKVSVNINGDIIQLDRATTRQQRALVDAYVRRHSGG
jgi:hypothetical protein